jgi:hypothetical protein
LTAPEPFLSLLYVSRNLIPDAALGEEVRAILAAARRHNPRLGITGALLFSPDTFAQVLEGPPEAVEALYARLLRDPRHADCVVVARREVAARQFGRWSMAFAGRRDDLRFAYLRPGGGQGSGGLDAILLQGASGGEAPGQAA